MSTLPRRLVVGVAFAGVLLGLPAVPAGAQKPDPGGIVHAQHQVVAAQARLKRLVAAAKQAAADYSAALVGLRQAQAAAHAARVALAAATADAAAQQQQVNSFARAAYMSGGPLTAVASVLSATGPAAVLDRAALLGAVSNSQSTVLAGLVDARDRQGAAADAATAAAADVAQQVARADEARRAALKAMADQRTKLAAMRAALAESWKLLEAAGETLPLATPKQGRRVVKWAERQLGIPYSWGGGDEVGPTLGMVNEQGNAAGLTTVGFDCSGLTLFAWAHVGFALDHYTGYQWLEGHHIPLDRLQPGDLVFFAHNTANPLSIHHVGIYVGGGRMIDAPHTGAAVRYDPVFVPGLIGAVRP